MKKKKKNRERNLNSYNYNTIRKAHTTITNIFFLPLYAEHTHFVLKRVNWIATKIDTYYTFEQSKLKKINHNSESNILSKTKKISQKRLL